MLSVQSVTGTVRRVELDRLRGLAILLMVADHVALFAGLPLVRVTAGRLAMPLFFLLAGHLAGSRLSRRHGYAFGLGLVLPVLAPWVDAPNVLVWFSIGAVLLYIFDQRNIPTWWLLLPGLVFAANGWPVNPGGHSYDPLALLALMALGRGLAPAAFIFGSRLPAALEFFGRRPLSWYVGHVLVLQLLAVAFGWSR